MKLVLNDSSVTWPGNSKSKPEGFLIPTHLKVITIEEKPFVYLRKTTDNRCNTDEVVCHDYNPVGSDLSKFHQLTLNIYQFFDRLYIYMSLLLQNLSETLL